ncbi:LuxR C-terminal-related transcriptional regulator [Paraburkholderia saeva]|uniref:Serine/threonine-protein kinase PknK n=1 Tax=Paraburkholderia saeva TaxID=2777537 RepID=A0A9N8RZR2_9BURK|nr:LuxR C-terminal-related transcriptional regulator [Paraburkholderia saeva]CAG4889758.1 Serine/threonine-protein kinase PknK [Paraburkholderia saeva]CAG4897181.1 Serine/threonine-protein kinase PknK [Paraburkholderia saeva]CAG4913330.1 Serine/threonine-protein kinase PknK [Paraburkholderia saeva]
MPQNFPPADPRRSPGAAAESRSDPRLTPPRSSARIVARERLLTQLLDARRNRCIVLQGPAGCGKTSLLIVWREALLSLGFDIAWLTLVPEDNELTHFLDYLVASLAQVDPAMSHEAALLGGRGMDDETVERTIIALVRGIAAHPNDVVLVLDDLHHITSPRHHEALQWLLDYAPANLHLVFVSRGTVPLSLGRPRDQGLVLELDMRDLRFSAAESEAFLKAQLGQISPRDARHMHELTDGWVAGLQLFAMRLKRKKQGGTDVAAVDPPNHAQLLDARGFAEYFERQVLSRLAPSEVELLIRMAGCTRVCAPLCVALTGDEQSPAEVRALLTRLESDNLFIAPIESSGSESWYRLNPLFRETLLERFRARSELHQREVHLAAWIWFRDHEQPDDAVRHALLAGEPAAAADLVLSVARTMQIRGELRKLVVLIRLLPLAEVQARIGLRLWMVHLQLYAREFEACAADIARLHDDIPEGDAHSRYRLILLKAALAVQRDDTHDAMSVLPQLQQIPVHADSLAVGGRNNLLSWIYMRRGEYEEARRVQSEAPPLFVDGAPLLGTSAGALNGRCIAGFSYALEGKFIQVERISRDVLFDADQRGSAAAEAACFAAALLGEVLYEFNDLEAARKLLEDRVDVLERVSIPDSVLRVLTVLSAVHWATGHHLDAFAWLERLEEYASQYGLSRLVAHSVAEQIHRHLQGGQFDAAEAGLARLDMIAGRAAATSSGTVAEIHAMAERSHINWCIAHEDFDGAASRLQALVPFCEARGWQRHVAHFQMQAAVVDARRGRADAARQAVLAALRRGHRLGLVRSLLDAAPGALDLIADVAQGEAHDPVLSFYVNRLQAAQKATAASVAQPAAQSGARSAPPAGAEMLSERETRVVGLLAQALPNKKIARTLGISPETVKWHLKNIYGKLGVTSRDEAVARVRDLELGSPAAGGDEAG